MTKYIFERKSGGAYTIVEVGEKWFDFSVSKSGNLVYSFPLKKKYQGCKNGCTYDYLGLEGCSIVGKLLDMKEGIDIQDMIGIMELVKDEELNPKNVLLIKNKERVTQ